MEDLKSRVINWLKTKSAQDIAYVKEDYQITIFGKHAGITNFDVEQIVEEPDKKIKEVEKSVSHEDRLLILRTFSKKFDTAYIILDPFNPALETKFRGKVAIVTVYPTESYTE